MIRALHPHVTFLGSVSLGSQHINCRPRRIRVDLLLDYYLTHTHLANFMTRRGLSIAKRKTTPVVRVTAQEQLLASELGRLWLWYRYYTKTITSGVFCCSQGDR